MNTKKVMALTQEYRVLEEQRQELLRKLHKAITEYERKPRKMPTPKKKLKGLKTKNTPGGRTAKQRARKTTRNTTSTGAMTGGESGIGS